MTTTGTRGMSITGVANGMLVNVMARLKMTLFGSLLTHRGHRHSLLWTNWLSIAEPMICICIGRIVKNRVGVVQ